MGNLWIILLILFVIFTAIGEVVVYLLFWDEWRLKEKIIYPILTALGCFVVAFSMFMVTVGPALGNK